MRAKARVGLCGLGRLGQVYARNLRGLVSGTDLIAVCDVDPDTLDRVADEFEVETRYRTPQELIDDPRVDAVVIVTPTHSHRELVEAAAARGKAIFCEKPLSISLADSVAMQRAVEQSGVFFQMGFMRRFDASYAAARQRIEQGEVGDPIVFKSTSRDPFRPSLEYLRLSSSGGIFIDMGIHDFDLALWFFGEVARIHCQGAVLAYPEIQPLGDIDNAVSVLNFRDGRLGIIDLSRSGFYGYDISTEILGTAGTIRIGYLRETRIEVLKQNQVSHDTVPYFMERFAQAYTAQLQNFADNLLRDMAPPITLDDGIRALQVATAATLSWKEDRPVELSEIT